MTPGKTFCGHSDTPNENGQSPCMRPSAPYDIATEPKNATSKNDNTRDVVVIFLNIGCIFVCYNSFALRRSELETTETLERAIARPAKTGESSQPNTG